MAEVLEPYEPHQARYLLHLLKPLNPEWFIDCGPGLGKEAKVIKDFFPKIEVIGIEPSAAAVKAIGVDYPGTLLQAAAWSKEGMKEFFFPNSCLQGTCVRGDPKWIGVAVRALTLDSIAERYGLIGRTGFLWMDTERSEEFILLGAKKLLDSHKVLAINAEVYDGDREDMIDGLLGWFGYQKELSYVYQGAHHDNFYLLKV